jgi:outer membrane protein TolC
MFTRRRLLAGLIVAAGGLAPAQEPAKPDADPNGVLVKPAAPTGEPFTLGQCLALAAERQPRIRVALHSLRAAELGLQGLSGLGRIADRLSPDLPVRRQQAALGLRVAEADVELARQNTTHDVTFLYFSHVYARQAEQTAADVVEQLDVSYNVAKELLDTGITDPRVKVDRLTLSNLQNLIAEVRSLRLEAETKRKQTLVALKEAMGVGAECDFHPATKELPIMAGSVGREQVVGLALAGRPELVQAAAGVDVFNLEPCAQARVKLRPQVNTLAAGTDLHKTLVPLALRNGQYRPGAVAPEMPTSLVGKTGDRVARATELAARQGAVYEVAVGLVRLEAENAFIDFESAAAKMALTKKRFETARRAVEEARLQTAARPDPQLLVNSEAFAGRAQADYVEAVYKHLVALAKLERVTAGGVRPAFPGR